MDNFAAKRLANTLMAKTNTQDGFFTDEMLDCLNRYTGFIRSAGTGGNYYLLGIEFLHLRDSNLVIAEYLYLNAQFTEVLHQVIGKGIVVVDHQ
jgi:hypothetical protein